MSNRRFEMYEYRQALHRMRLGQSNRTIAKSGLMGRRKAAELKRIAKAQGWLNKEAPLPDDALLLTHLDKKPDTPTQQSLVVPYADEVKSWWQNDIAGVAIYQALVRKYDFPGSYSCVRR